MTPELEIILHPARAPIQLSLFLEREQLFGVDGVALVCTKEELLDETLIADPQDLLWRWLRVCWLSWHQLSEWPIERETVLHKRGLRHRAQRDGGNQKRASLLAPNVSVTVKKPVESMTLLSAAS